MPSTSAAPSNDDLSGVPAGRVLVVSDEFVTSLGPAGLRSYTDAVLDAASGAYADVDELTEALAASLDRIGIPMAPVEVQRVAEQLFGAQAARVSILTTAGDLVAERDGVAGTPQRSATAADPDNPDRPNYS